MKGLVYKKLRYPVGGEVRALTRLSGLTYRIVHSTNRTQQFCPVNLTCFGRTTSSSIRISLGSTELTCSICGQFWQMESALKHENLVLIESRRATSELMKKSERSKCLLRNLLTVITWSRKAFHPFPAKSSAAGLITSTQQDRSSIPFYSKLTTLATWPRNQRRRLPVLKW